MSEDFSFSLVLKQIKIFSFNTLNSVPPESAIFQKNNYRRGP